MHSTPPHWKGWPLTSQPEHSTKELENRLTHLEINSEEHTQKLSLHERAILGILGALYVLAQDRFPVIAEVIRGVLQ